MKNENEVTGNIFFELDEMNRVGEKSEGEGPYSITVSYGGVLTIFCCP